MMAVRLHHIMSMMNTTTIAANQIENVMDHIGAILLERGEIMPHHALVRNPIDTIIVTMSTITLNMRDSTLFDLGGDVYRLFRCATE